MKKLTYILPIFLLFLFGSFTPPKGENKTEKATELKWYNWNEGYPMAVKSNKIVLVDLYTSWCGWCKRMDKDTYTNEDVVSFINKKFVPIKLNPEVDGKYKIDSLTVTGPQLMGMLTNNQSTGYPTIVFIYTKNREIEIMPGYQDAANFKATLEKVVETSNKKKK